MTRYSLATPRALKSVANLRFFKKAFRLSIALSGAVFLSGCALLNPYINIDEHSEELKSAKEVCGLDARPGIRRACMYRSEYLHRLGLDASYRNVLGLTLIPISATALGLGIDGGNSTAITVLGLSGATLYASGQVLTSRPRETVLLQGLQAITCAVTASYSMTLDQQSQDILTSSTINEPSKTNEPSTIDELAMELGELKAANLALRIELSTLPATNPVKPALEAYANQIDILAQNAKTLGERATAIRNWLDARDVRLGLVADRINDGVNENISRTIIDLEGIMAVIGGLMPNATLIAPTPEVEQPTVPSTEEATGPQATKEAKSSLDEEAKSSLDAAKDIQQALAAVLGLSQQLQNVVALFASSDLSVDIEGCNLEVPDEVFQLQLLPTGDLSIEENTAWPGALSIEGGSPQFTAKLIGSNSENITLTVAGRSVVINVSVGAKPGSYSILVRDKTGQTAVKNLTITPTSNNPSPPENSHITKEATDNLDLCAADAADALFMEDGKFVLYGEEKSLEDDLVARQDIQRGIKLAEDAIDGKFGRPTRENICAWQQSEGFDPANGVLTTAQIETLIASQDGNPYGD